MPPASVSNRPPPELAKRILSALFLAPIALVGAWMGGAVWLAGASVVALLILWEWNKLCRDGRMDAAAIAAAVAVVAAAVGMAFGFRLTVLAGFGCALALAAVSGVFDRATAWAIRGAAYALAFLVPVLVLREGASGAVAIFFLFAVVWATDVCAFFSGRAIGGPKLWPAVSPKKTWAGFVGGSLGGALAAFGLMMASGHADEWQMLVAALALSFAAHGGDLFESWVKRLFHQKDSGHLIPGHGGAMDRLDGFIFAATLALAIGLARGGPWNAAEGLTRW